MKGWPQALQVFVSMTVSVKKTVWKRRQRGRMAMPDISLLVDAAEKAWWLSKCAGLLFIGFEGHVLQPPLGE